LWGFFGAGFLGDVLVFPAGFAAGDTVDAGLACGVTGLGFAGNGGAPLPGTVLPASAG